MRFPTCQGHKIRSLPCFEQWWGPLHPAFHDKLTIGQTLLSILMLLFAVILTFVAFGPAPSAIHGNPPPNAHALKTIAYLLALRLRWITFPIGNGLRFAKATASSVLGFGAAARGWLKQRLTRWIVQLCLDIPELAEAGYCMKLAD